MNNSWEPSGDSPLFDFGAWSRRWLHIGVHRQGEDKKNCGQCNFFLAKCCKLRNFRRGNLMLRNSQP